jgi:3-methyladenine DNA glycosylase AlkC
MTALLKDCYNPAFVRDLAEKTAQFRPSFPVQEFISAVLNEDWEGRELKERMHWVADQLYNHLGLDYPEAIELLLQVEPILDSERKNHALTLLVFPDVVERFGLEHWEVSMNAMENFTKASSAEFAIRPFLKQDSERGMQQMMEWALHEHEGVRRLASEGCRPRLPWAMALPDFKRDPSPVLPVLEQLKADPSLYVRRSVANNLNDIAKDHPERVLDVAEAWFGESEETDWLVRHGLRTLLKQGRPRALALFGLSQEPPAQILSFVCSKSEVSKGEAFEMLVELEVEEACDLRIEFEMEFLRKRGTSKKVFRWSEKTFSAGVHSLQKSYLFKDLSTRKHYPGVQGITIVLNGVAGPRCEVVLQEES